MPNDSGYFASSDPDHPRKYNQVTYAKRMSRVFTDGILEGIGDELQVSPTDPATLAVVVGTGECNIQGYWMDQVDPVTLTLADADATYDRIDLIVVHADIVEGLIVEPVVLTGVPATSPVAPALTQTSNVWELPLAQVYISAGTTSVISANITDKRNTEFSPRSPLIYTYLLSPNADVVNTFTHTYNVPQNTTSSSTRDIISLPPGWYAVRGTYLASYKIIRDWVSSVSVSVRSIGPFGEVLSEQPITTTETEYTIPPNTTRLQTYIRGTTDNYHQAGSIQATVNTGVLAEGFGHPLQSQ